MSDADINDARDTAGTILQGFLDDGNVAKANEVIEELYITRIGLPESSGGRLAFVLGGIAVGAVAGGAAGFIFAKRQLETKYNQIAEEEIAEMREHYRQKAVALESEAGKGDLEDIVRKKGYVPDETEEEEVSSTPPMAVTPPAAVVQAADEAAEEEAEIPPPPEEDPEPVVQNVFRDTVPPPADNWDWHKERAQRSPLRPYVIHIDEREEQDAYDDVHYTYYEMDDVVCNERDDVLSPEDRENIIGESNLELFGHGSGDATVVYVRNDQLEMDIAVDKSPNSFAQEVHGFEPEIKHANRRERKRFEDE